MTRTPYLPPGPDLQGDWFADDPALRRFVSSRMETDAWKALEPRLARLGQDAPRRLDALARVADARGPRLDEHGEVVLDPCYRELQQAARAHEVFNHSWLSGAPRLATFALGYLYGQAECGYYCPACMTDGAALVLDRYAAPDVKARTIPRLMQRQLDGAFEGAMLLTEPQGGSDVGATQTRARRDGSDWLLTGDKWFASNANADVVLTLARLPDAPAGTQGLGLFLILPAGDAGFIRRRLKDKLGVRSMATAEVQLRDAHATLLAGEGAGFKAMAEMVNLSRLYNAVASVAVARRALREGQRNARWREAFGRPLAELPLYQRALAALSNDVRGALFLTLDTADAFDRAPAGAAAFPLLRALTPVAKAGTARLAVEAASAACEMLGGNGYVEEWVTPRLLRDAQVLPIWEGTTSVQALDLLRAALKDGALAALAEDSLRRLDGAHEATAAAANLLREAWPRLAAHELAEVSAVRLLDDAFALRAASLLVENARDGDAEAEAHAHAFIARRVLKDETAFEARLATSGRLLAGA